VDGLEIRDTDGGVIQDGDEDEAEPRFSEVIMTFLRNPYPFGGGTELGG